MSKPNFEAMSREELARFMVSHRDTPDEIEARSVYIRRMAENAKRCGIEFYKPHLQPNSVENNSDR
ncbi:hypothetical protein VB715_06875 [Crocosphaera sp. UHCC 0190]|uniref:DUF6887 family protein n=1 Tax=Crocosphaera sp. UHCC 0190 TaxID=3110246 RepID=UPI002B1F78A9|nr:hypothetical protein [Crocosphaera sp. UHCC 0190]MEA5509483.1 hypothetical protein [Crocosphaera sp. UHCC 0190]